ncbi:hypothetical protein [Streptomyces sp. MS2.AVA.5]|uniref:Uncharacterized protein n=1 Tax=Streptomyces achmelvichensis TaxID=3134111 RepID=A0ACC6PWE3_9ACTN
MALDVSLHAEQLDVSHPEGLCIDVIPLDFPLSNYLPEIAVLAMDGWLRAEFDLPDQGGRAEFSSREGTYSFRWGGGSNGLFSEEQPTELRTPESP